jgi:uncharacterized protein YndB with AHSA1/START domain
MSQTQITVQPGMHAVQVTREFNGPRALLFRAFTEPDLLVQWLGPRKYTMEIDRYEVRDGGTWRYVHRDDEGNAFGFHGVFHGAPSPERMVQTFEFEGYPGHVSLDTATFEEKEGKTVLRMSSVFQSVEDRDGMIASGMEEGMNEGFDRLDELLAKLVAND